MALTLSTNRMTSGAVVSILDFGAVAGSAGVAATNTQAILDAVATGNPVTVPAGTFKVNTITFPQATNVKLRGEDHDYSVLEYQSATGNLLDWEGEGDGSTIENLRLESSVNSTGRAINMDAGGNDGYYMRDIYINRISISNFKDGIHIANTVNVLIEKFWRGTGISPLDGSGNTGTGIYISRSSGGSSNAAQIRDIYIHGYKIGIRNVASPCMISKVIIEYSQIFIRNETAQMSLKDTYFYSPDAVWNADGANTGELLNNSGGGYVQNQSIRLTNSSLASTNAYNFGSNTRYTTWTDRKAYVMAWPFGNKTLVAKTTSYVTSSDWKLLDFSSDSAVTNNYCPDSEGNYTAASAKFTAPHPGLYRIDLQVTLDIRTVGTYAIGIYGGVNRLAESINSEHAVPAARNLKTLHTSCITWLDMGDEVTARAYNGTAVNVQYEGSMSESWDRELGSGTSANNPPHLSFISIQQL